MIFEIPDHALGPCTALTAMTAIPFGGTPEEGHLTSNLGELGLHNESIVFALLTSSRRQTI